MSHVDRLRAIALALPETHEEVTWGEDLNFRVGKKIFCFPGASSMTVKADPEELEALLGDPRFARAAYVGRFGWVTMSLPKRPDWDEIGELILTSYCLVAPKRLVKLVTAADA
jgi:predicted DNA-binding protein (MmcQ/YjbR family)